MTATFLNPPEHRWQCPSCLGLHVTREARPHTPMHPCPALGGLTAPFVEVHGTELAHGAARHVVVEREDYIGGSNAGRTMALRTERADGSNDCTVYAPTATASAVSHE